MKNLIIIIFVVLSNGIYGQSLSWYEMLNDPNANFFNIQNAYNNYEKSGGEINKQYKRWENFWESRINPDGTFPKQNNIAIEYSKYFLKNGTDFKTGTLEKGGAVTTGNWECIGPAHTDNYDKGVGRINVIEFSPENSAIAYVGTPSGGLWKTENIDASPVVWKPLTDYLPHIGVSAIAIEKLNPNVIYIGTGDKDQMGTVRGIGILKSVDSGNTWTYVNNDTGSLLEFATVHELIIAPNNDDIIYAATDRGFFKSNNGGSTWKGTMIKNLNTPDLKIHPSNSNILYLSDYGTLYKSYDAGETWHLKEDFSYMNVGRLEFEVTKNKPDLLYLVAGNNTTGQVVFYKSNDSGEHFDLQNNTEIMFMSGSNCQARYDISIAADPVNSDIVYVGGILLWSSNNKGVSWSLKYSLDSDDPIKYIHADQHFLKFRNESTLYICNDGGLYEQKKITVPFGGQIFSVNKKNGNLNISQIYNIGLSQIFPRTLVGMQDNGTAELKDEWLKVSYGDGMECLYDFENPNTRYFSAQYGAIFRKLDYSESNPTLISNGVDFGISDKTAWQTPFVLDHTDRNTMYIGYTELWRSKNVRAFNQEDIIWSKISNFSSLDNIIKIVQSEKSPNICVVITAFDVFISDNFLSEVVTFEHLYNSLPSTLNDICMDPENGKVFYLATNRGDILKTLDSGISFRYLNGSLPEISINSIVIDKYSKSGIYIGTDIGVFYIEDGMKDWIAFNNNLPNVIIEELEIYYNGDNSKLIAGTYGRGLWQSDLICRNLVTDLYVSGTLESTFKQAGNTLSSDATIKEYKNVIFRAGHEVKLNPGFEVEKGVTFESFVLPCGK